MTAKGIIHFNDSTSLEYKDCDIVYTDYGLMMLGIEGKLFIPYGSIKFASEK